MSALLMMPTTTAVDLIRGETVTTDIISQKEHPEQTLVGNTTLVQRTIAASGDDGAVNANTGLLDATAEEVMMWMMDGIDGITLFSNSAGVGVDMLEIGPDVDSSQLQAEASAGYSLLTDEAMDALPPDFSPRAEAIYQCEPEYTQVSDTSMPEHAGECWTDEQKLSEYRASIDRLTGYITSLISGYLNGLKNHMLMKNETVSMTQENSEMMLEMMLDFFTARLTAAMGGMLAPMFAHIAAAGGTLAAELASHVINNFFVDPVVQGVSQTLRAGSTQENNQTVSASFIIDFIMNYSTGITVGLHTSSLAVQNEDIDTIIAYDAMLESISKAPSTLQETVFTSALDSFLAAAAEDTVMHRRRREGGDIGSEIYQIEIIPWKSLEYWGRKGIHEVRVPEAIPNDLVELYLRNTTLRGKRLILATGPQGSDTSHVDFNTYTCEVRGLGSQDPRSAVRGGLFPLVRAYFPEEYERFYNLVSNALVPQGGGMDTEAIYSHNSAASYEIQKLCEDALRLWFIDSIEEAGGLDTPLAELKMK